MSLKQLILLLQRTIQEFGDDNCPHMAAAISYYVLFSAFPLALALISLLGFVMESREVERAVIASFSGVTLLSEEFLTSTIRGVVDARGVTGIVAVLGVIWSASAAFGAIRKSLNTAWDLTRPRNIVHQKVVDVVMVLSVGVLFWLSLTATAVLRVVQDYGDTLVDAVLFLPDIPWDLLAASVPLGFSFLTFLLVYRFVPNTTVHWRDAALGAGVGALGFEVGKDLFVFYLQNFANYNVLYGPIGSVFALLTWAYVSAAILLFGAELASEYMRLRDPSLAPSEVNASEGVARRNLSSFGGYQQRLREAMTVARARLDRLSSRLPRERKGQDVMA